MGENKREVEKKKLEQPSTKKLAEAANKWLVPALQEKIKEEREEK